MSKSLTFCSMDGETCRVLIQKSSDDKLVVNIKKEFSDNTFLGEVNNQEEANILINDYLEKI